MSENEFYIQSANGKEGPYDLMLMMRKINNGKLAPQDMIFAGDAEEARPAIQIPELTVYFDDSQEPETSKADKPQKQKKAEKRPKTPKPEIERIIDKLSLTSMLRDAWLFFVENQILGFLTGGVMLVTLLATLLLDTIFPTFMTTFLSCILSAYLFYLFMIFTLQRVRSQEISVNYWKGVLKKTSKPLLIASVIGCGIPIGLPIIIGGYVSSVFYLFVIPGLVIFTVLIFVPLVIYDRPELSYKKALEQSTYWVRAIGLDNLGVLVGLVFINLICATAIFLPLFITVPLTAIALTDLYEEHFLS